MGLVSNWYERDFQYNAFLNLKGKNTFYDTSHSLSTHDHNFMKTYSEGSQTASSNRFTHFIVYKIRHFFTRLAKHSKKQYQDSIHIQNHKQSPLLRAKMDCRQSILVNMMRFKGRGGIQNTAAGKSSSSTSSYFPFSDLSQCYSICSE